MARPRPPVRFAGSERDSIAAWVLKPSSITKKPIKDLPLSGAGEFRNRAHFSIDDCGHVPIAPSRMSDRWKMLRRMNAGPSRLLTALPFAFYVTAPCHDLLSRLASHRPFLLLISPPLAKMRVRPWRPAQIGSMST